MTVFAHGLGAARMGKAKLAYDLADQLEAFRQRFQETGENYWAMQVQIEEAEVRAWAFIAESNAEKALQTMHLVAGLEDGTEKSAITPGPLAPARELYGEMLLQLDQPAQALDQFESSLNKEPERLRSLYGAGRAAQLAGRTGLSQSYFRKLMNICELGDKPGRKELLDAERCTQAVVTRTLG